MTDIQKSSLLKALNKVFDTNILDAEYATELLQGGDVGEVHKISGKALIGNASYPFALVLKNQHKWERHGDPDCWRREYEIYKHGFDQKLLQTVKLPRCYLLQESGDFTHIWMEYIKGTTGNEQLHAPELALAAENLGELQAEFHCGGQRDLPYLRSYPAMRSSFDLWWGRMKEPLSAKIDGFPDELRSTLNNYAARASSLLDSFDNLPLTICHGDFYHDNIIFKAGIDRTDIYLIDWDCAGYGKMGEDAVDVLMEAFVYSSRDVSMLPDFRRCIIEAYCKGVNNRGVDFTMDENLVRNIFALAWGFRVADHYLYHKEEHEKNRCIEILQAMLREDWE